jgi:hypothetical protein
MAGKSNKTKYQATRKTQEFPGGFCVSREDMPVIVDTFVNEAGETINVYESGAHYNATRKHLVKAPESAMITKENVHRFKEQLAEKKREAIVRGASRALEKAQPGEWTAPNALDVAEALAEAITMKAMNPDNPKQVDAARFILQEAGLAESQAKASEDGQQSGRIGELAALLREMRLAIQGQTAPAKIVNVDAVDVPALDTDTRNE